MLTGVVLNVAQGTTIQIWFGLLSSSAASLIMVRFEPYREPLCNLLQKAATIQILFTYMTATIFFEGNAADAMEYNDGLGVLLLLGNSVMYAVLFISSMINVLSDQCGHCTMESVIGMSSQTRPLAPSCLYQHQWSKGQDQAKTIKQTLRTPATPVFLDVDDLHSIDEIEDHAERSDVMLVFLTGSTRAASTI